MTYEPASHRTTRTLESVKYDEEAVEREQRRLAALKLRPELAARIEQGIRTRVPMKRIRKSS